MSKLSLHISNWLDPDTTFEFIERAQPSIIKVFAEGGLDDLKLREAKRRAPGTLVIGRVYIQDQLLEHLDESFPGEAIKNYDPLADAQSVFQQMRDSIEKFDGLVDVWEGLNEVPIDDDNPLASRNYQRARAYSNFTVALAKLMHGAGQKYAAYSFSTGNPIHSELWYSLLDGLRASDYLALHEYIAPDQTWTHFDLGMCNRYRKIYARLPQDARRPVLITECGDDYFGQQGYLGMISEDQYLSHLQAYDASLMQDPYVLGATVYCYGISGPQWKSYDIGGSFAKRLSSYIIATPTPAGPNVPPAKPLDKDVNPSQPPSSQPESAEANGNLPFDKARWWAEEATRQLEAGNPEQARVILVGTVIPWFYITAPHLNSAAAAAADKARWFSEEAVRMIQAGRPDAAHELAKKSIIPWFYNAQP